MVVFIVILCYEYRKIETLQGQLDRALHSSEPLRKVPVLLKLMLLVVALFTVFQQCGKYGAFDN